MAEADYKEKWRYQTDFPEDRSSIVPALRLLETYSGIPADEIDSHIIEVVNNPWS